jgi:hypothetical protein
MLFLLYAVHALLDFPLQGDFLAKAKNRHSPMPDIPWELAMFSHCLIQALGVFLITQSLALAGTELCLHFLIDCAKNEGKTSFFTDQMLHYLCKSMYVILIFGFLNNHHYILP